jgi:hypothetical protein
MNGIFTHGQNVVALAGEDELDAIVGPNMRLAPHVRCSRWDIILTAVRLATPIEEFAMIRVVTTGIVGHEVVLPVGKRRDSWWLPGERRRSEHVTPGRHTGLVEPGEVGSWFPVIREHEIALIVVATLLARAGISCFSGLDAMECTFMESTFAIPVFVAVKEWHVSTQVQQRLFHPTWAGGEVHVKIATSAVIFVPFDANVRRPVTPVMLLVKGKVVKAERCQFRPEDPMSFVGG